MLVDWLSNTYIGHPLVQAIVSDAGKAFWLCLFLVMVGACLFLGFFAKSCRYTFPPHSLSERCWKATWLLQIVALLILACNFYENKHDMPTEEIIFVVSPYVLMIISFVLAGRYYQTTGKALQEAEKDKYGKHSRRADRAANNRRL